MGKPLMFSDVAVIEARIENGSMTSEDAQQALNDLEVLYDLGEVSADEKRRLQVELWGLL